jgi:hypothetical protein
MTVGEYEERFRRPAPSWHQILVATQSPNRTRRRKRRWLVGAALIAVITLATEIAPHHDARGHTGKGSVREPVFDVLLGDFWRIFDLVRNGCTRGGPSQTAHAKEPFAGADR